ncbi:TPR-like protein [Saccharata proteae CBS 121410]|uniref:TPR-like protein n=1 Tax=Saccharata proteae CBS 121410 TaxID=1314787 RepID=A0A9P4M085_9PEZI|nr:TPR-like protein [Saccharata proteae CBS 121410]
MASHQQPSPTMAIPPHNGPPGHPQTNGHGPLQPQPKGTTSSFLTQANESIWLYLGQVSENIGDNEGARQCYDHALRHNAWSIPAMQAISCILRTADNFHAAAEYLKNILKIDANNGEVWGSLGHCYLMMDDLQQAYSAYQQALYHLQDPKEPKLWYGIGILYDRYGSLEHAEEAFSQVMHMEPTFDKANEIYFRLGIIYKQQQKFSNSLECFKYIVNDPPRPLTEEDIWFQIGHVYEQQKDFNSAKSAYRRVLERDQNHAKVLQQLGWLHHQESQPHSQDQAIDYLEKSVASDQTDAQSWYLLGRCYMAQHKYPKAYEAYQQAVYRDGRNPTFWCSIGVLYYQINQYRDALDAYSRAIRLNPNISEVWYDLGTLYESCNNQTADALDAYQRAADLDPMNVHIKARLSLLQNGQPTNGMPNQNSAPLPQDVHPQAYQPGAMNGPPQPQWGGPGQPQAAAQGPLPPALGGSGNDWGRRLAGIQDPQMPPQQLGPYDQRDGIRQPPPHPAPHPASPRQEPMRPYQEPPRVNPPATGRRGLSPSPKSHHAAPSLFQGPNSLPPQVPPPAQLQQPQPQPPQNRITNPNYGGHPGNASVPPPPPPPPGAMGGPPPPRSGPMPPYGRMGSPPPEVRPLIQSQSQAASPSTHYPHPPYQHHPADPAAPGGIAGGAPAPASALAAAEAAAREHNDRTPTTKRHREWEDDASASQKPPTNDEKRPRLEETPTRRPSPPDRMASNISQPQRTPPELEEARRAEESRHINDGYHPSEAAHHPPSLSALQPPQQPQPLQQQETIKEERKEQHEPAARKMEVDEDYDESGDDEKRAAAAAAAQPQPPRSERNSPRSASVAQNGLAHPPPTPMDTKPIQ